jgi:tetratricopeptide (TPR) repeat protein
VNSGKRYSIISIVMCFIVAVCVSGSAYGAENAERSAQNSKPVKNAKPAQNEKSVQSSAPVDQELSKDPFIQDGMKDLDEDKPDAALISFDKYLLKNPNSPGALLMKGTALSRLHRDQESIPVFQKAIQQFDKTDHQSALAYSGLGSAYLILNRIDEAIAQLDLADSVTPDNPIIQVLLARAYLGKKNPYWAHLALIHLDRAEALDFKARYVPLLRARGLELSGQREEAQAILNKEIEALPKTPESAQLKAKLESVIQHLQTAKEPKDGPTPPEKRHYDLKATPLFTVTKTDKEKNLVTVVTASGRDADGGSQDGENDGYMVMPKSDFDAQAELKGASYKLKQ